ncbi:unnamed protein product [Paramecium sonneborni]|uniref:Tetratricopeptide repeat protein n=1 Tax=Paramecium sonneborni TaxID=65129 RepID=A0A8S1NN25_9CILI|nr:unnamed protein product [Paramecium sonneborni]
MKKILQEKIDKHLQNAKQLVKTDVHEAIKEYYKILFLNKNHLQSYQDLAQLYVKIGDYSPAIACLQYSYSVKQDILVEDELQALILLKGQSLLEQGDVTNFLEGTEFEQFGYLIDFSVPSLQKAYSYLLTNYLNYTLQEVQKVIANDPLNINALLLRGKLYWAQGKIAQGNCDYWKVHSMNPELQEIKEFILYITPKIQKLTNDAKLYLVQRDNERCKLNVDKGLELDPNNVDLLLLNAYLCRINIKYDVSLNLLKKAFDQQPTNEDIKKQLAITYNEMAQVMFEKGNYEDALTLLNEALTFKPLDWGILVNRGDAFKYLGRLKESITDYNKAYEIEKNETVAQRLAIIHHSFGVEFFNKKQYQLAYESFDKAIKLANSVDILFKRGKCLLYLQNPQLALKDFEKVIQMDPNHYEASTLVRQMTSSTTR